MPLVSAINELYEGRCPLGRAHPSQLRSCCSFRPPSEVQRPPQPASFVLLAHARREARLRM